MKPERDPFELLGDLRPTELDAPPIDLADDERAAAILQRVRASDVVVSLDTARRRRRRILGGGLALVVVSTGSIVAAAAWRHESPREARHLSCWSAAATPPPIQVGLPWDGQADPISICRVAWTGGELGHNETAPDLVACVSIDGAAVVVPGPPDTCAAVGLANYSPINDPQVLAVQRAGSTIDEQINESTCLDEADATNLTRRILDDAGLTTWRIELGRPFTADEPCATVGLDTSSQTAFVLPVRGAG